ncbi:tripartite tricarboxylate transporter permease [Radicibacter daui]|uniref:tripartite tricarboxylate transporter permease n=1 Tax=Radicibacter daui TaxID=3064829 RepID=UPI0040469BC7
MQILGYLVAALTPYNLLLALAGVSLGTIVGALPGLSATMAVAVLVPFTFAMDPASGLIALGAIYTGAIYGGAFAAILVNTPGTPSSIATTFDGYPMARKGDGGLAITLATISSVVGGLVGAISLLLLAPPLARVALAFGPTEYFWLAIFGLTLIASLSVGNTLKGLIGACFGLFLSTIGVAVVGGDVRYTLGMQRFLGGIDLTSAIIGLYCIPVILDLVATPNPHLRAAETGGLRLAEGFRLAWANKLNVLRSSVIGTVIGILPGAGGSIAGLVSYTEARRASKDPDSFGKGNPNGVIATEAANNATVGGGFIPTLVLGIPGTPPDAIILGALLVQGIKIGPALFSAQGAVVDTFIWGLLIATVLMLPAGLLIGRYAFASVVKVPKPLLAATVALLTVIGAFAIHSNVDDVQTMVGLGLISWLLSRYGFAPSPIVLGLVLGQIAEQGFVQTYLIGHASGSLGTMFFGRPISIAIILAALATLLYPLVSQLRARNKAKTEGKAGAVQQGRDTGGVIAAGGFVILGALMLWGTGKASALGAVFPGTIAVAMIGFSLVLGFMLLRRRGAGRAPEAGLGSGTLRRIAIAALLPVWALLLSVTGFLVTSLAAFAVTMVIADYSRTSARTWIIRAIAGAAIVTGFWWIMVHVLLLRVPAGLFL